MKEVVVFGTGVFVLIISGLAYGGQVGGTVKFSGSPPPREPISMAADPTCAAIHSEPVLSESVLVNDNGSLRNVFVYVKQGLEGKSVPVPTTPVTMDQKGCQYQPHVFGIQVGQPLQIVNSDNTLHNVHSLAEKSKQFNLGMPMQGMKLDRTFSNPEVMVKMKCDVHPWMTGYVIVNENPFITVTGDSGNFSLQGLPAGTYTLEAWHEKYGTKTADVTVGTGETKSVDFSFSGS